MTKAGEKLLKAAREALEGARCEHDLTVVSRHEHTGGRTTIQECRLCHARFTTTELPNL